MEERGAGSEERGARGGEQEAGFGSLLSAPRSPLFSCRARRGHDPGEQMLHGPSAYSGRGASPESPWHKAITCRAAAAGLHIA